PQGAQDEGLERRSLEEAPGDEADGLLDHPVAHVEAAPDRLAALDIATDQEALDEHGERHGDRGVDADAGEEQERSNQKERHQVEAARQSGKGLEGEKIRRRAAGDEAEE